LAANKDEAVLVAVCDVVSEKAEKRKNEYADKIDRAYIPEIYTDYKKMLANQDIDVVTIATESGYHPEIAIYCMDKNKNVICEKPMALSIQDADAMIEASERNHVKLCICHQNRFNKPVQQLREAVEGNRFGRLVNGTARILWSRDMDYYNQAPWRGTW
ncbi:Gfo/Idh/MocA family protein, partial [Clostridium sp. MT-14]